MTFFLLPLPKQALCQLALLSVLGLAATANSTAHADTPLPREVLQALARAGVPASAVSMVVRSIPSPSSPSTSATNAPSDTAPATPSLNLISHHAQTARNPASVMKLVTTYAGLDILGPDFTWKTRVYTDGALNNGVLDGNLVVRGGGDPKLVLERITELFAQVRAKGVREVRGDLLLDNSVFNLPEANAADFDDEPLRPYNAAPDGLLVNFKSLIFTFTPDEANRRVLVRTDPPIAQVELPTELPLANGAGTPCGDWKTLLKADFSNPLKVQFGGKYAASCGERVWPVAYVQPRAYAGRVLQAMWLTGAQPTSLGGQTRGDKLPPSARLLHTGDSLPLREIIADINKFSNNVMAQQLFLSLSAYTNVNGPATRRASFEASQKTVAAWWKKTLPHTPPPVIENGSGLSRRERASAQALSDLLLAAANSPQAQVFADSLGIAGVDGTVQRMRDRNPEAQSLGRAQLKTGTLKDVAAVAGYVTALSGQRMGVVALINHPNAGAARPALDALVEWAVKQ
jgi:serine-type D-Ala-D-Ala carboxypeptidase/endopeptidase (penicillin-binding protein 4)